MTASGERDAPVSDGRRAVWVGAGYAAQGFGYAALVTALPAYKARQELDDAYVSVLLLLVCLAAAAGSVLADRVAARWGSRFALSGGLITVAAALGLTTFRTPTAVLTGILIVWGIGLGAVDASLSMQGVLVQARLRRSVMSRLFAAYTAAAIVAALLMSGVAASGAGAAVTVGVAAVIGAAVALGGWPSFEPGRTVAEPGGDPGAARRSSGLARVILICGALIFTAFLADSAVSTWSSVYLDDSLAAAPAVVPLGYAAYQAAVLLSRMVGDLVVPRTGRAVAAAGCLVVCALGCGLVVAVASVPAAVAGFALTGIGVGILVPLSFSAAGEASAGRSDEVIARVNLFNYGGALLGSVALGVLSEPVGLQYAFLIPVAGMVLALPVVGALRRLAAGPAGLPPQTVPPR
ncbi:MFS transporter [Mangrovihabitans endophyticus]|uniref:Putative transporter y4wD n=1 Tax=Mangrovihabitans endophyticus TaxID=1751298 RepID=A0A8J3BY41_9ACTN|nr:MFS transporter [Mangrovihabitans endophyticus]GGK91692.1 putative transporter y4wD [Mangrovihabitans endophyticus]